MSDCKHRSDNHIYETWLQCLNLILADQECGVYLDNYTKDNSCKIQF